MYKDDVGAQAGTNPSAVGKMKYPGGNGCGRLQRLNRREAVVHQKGKFRVHGGTISGAGNGSIGPGQDRNMRVDQLAYGFIGPVTEMVQLGIRLHP